MKLNSDQFVLEGIMTTLNHTASHLPTHPEVNIAPMGPIVDRSMKHFVFRPFKTSTTYQNLKRTGQGIFHVVDDALLLARAVTGQFKQASQLANLPLEPATHVQGKVIANCCRHYQLQVQTIDDQQERTTIHALAVFSTTQRDSLGWNRGQHAVLEAAILATRIHLTGKQAVLDAYVPLSIIVDKTGSTIEDQAMTMLVNYVQSYPVDPGPADKRETAN